MNSVTEWKEEYNSYLEIPELVGRIFQRDGQYLMLVVSPDFAYPPRAQGLHYNLVNLRTGTLYTVDGFYKDGLIAVVDSLTLTPKGFTLKLTST